MKGKHIMKNILIIDDNEEVLDIFEQLLLDEGYRVSTASNGTSGVLLFLRQNFDLVITDLNMQGMDGLDVIRRINYIVKVPTILMSSDYLPVEPDNVKFMGVNAVISKTIDDYDFCELVKYCLEDKVYESKVF
jgi:two-component system, OmpR family, response regulator VanR